MDVLAWLGVITGTIVMLLLVIATMVGSLALKPAEWDLEFQLLAHHEWHRRGLLGRERSLAEQQHMERMRGLGGSDSVPDRENRQIIVVAAAVLIGEQDHEKLALQLQDQGQELLRKSLDDVEVSVRNIADLGQASWVWRARRWRAWVDITFRSLRWFLPLWGVQLLKNTAKPLAFGSMAGVAGGLVYWLGGPRASVIGGEDQTWVDLVGAVGSIGLTVAIVIVAGRQLRTLAVAFAGSTRTLSRKRKVLLVVLLLSLIGLMALYRSGMWDEWAQAMQRFSSGLMADAQVSGVVTACALALVFGFATWRALAKVRARWISAGDRVFAFFGAVLFAVMAAIYLSLHFKAEKEIVLLLLDVFSVCLLVLVGIKATTWASEWGKRYRTLLSAGVEVERGWFRWWALRSWGVATGVVVLERLTRAAAEGLLPGPVAETFRSIATWFVLALVLSFWPGVFASARFIRRVGRAYASYVIDRSTRGRDETGQHITEMIFPSRVVRPVSCSRG